MATVRYCIYCLFLVCSLNCKNISDTGLIPTVGAQTPLDQKLDKDSVFFEKKEDNVKDKKPIAQIKLPSIQEIYSSQIGVRELTGKNDGKAVEMYLKSCGLGKGFSYCSAFVKWSFDSARVKTTITAWSPTAENKRRIIYQNGKFTGSPKSGDVVCFYYSNLGRIGHTGFFDSPLNDKIYISVEANTSGSGSVDAGVVRDGNGVFKKYRSYRSTKSISQWIN